ncbi:hypothetical protein ACFY78_16505 [Streptomyces olindensis]|uniref:hypothetical protein n=1 Tax=Streptomyces olindensis TaxID=358823 RepID=UPI0036BFE5E9
MSTRTTFEDRLLDGLKSEIERREAATRRAGQAATGGGEDSPAASPHPLFRPRRMAVVALACAAAWLAAVVVPGSPADSPAYAVAPRGDGSVRLTVKDQDMSVEAQYELARKVSSWGVHVTVDVLPAGQVCERSRVTPLAGVDRRGERVPIIPMKARWDVTLRPGSVLAFENTRGASRPRAVEFYRTRAEAEPCVPVRVTLPED